MEEASRNPRLPKVGSSTESGSNTADCFYWVSKDSLLPYEGKLDHWIGLWKDTGQVWKWANGTEFDRRFEIQGGADCVYLDEELAVTTSSCSTSRKWICSKPDTPAKGEERAVGGDS
nr:C-type lectin domain family 2 member D-like [Chrysemys picta bellii]